MEEESQSGYANYQKIFFKELIDNKELLTNDKKIKITPSKEKVLESNIKNICRNYLSIPQFKGLKQFGIWHAVFFSYYLSTALSPRNRVRNIYSEFQVQLLHVFWTKYVPNFFRNFGTLTSNAIIFGDEKRNAESLKIIKEYIFGLSADHVNELIGSFVTNISEIRYMYSICNPTYYYQTNSTGLNIKLRIDSNIRNIRKRKLDQLERNSIGEAKPKTMSPDLINKLHPFEQKMVVDENKLTTAEPELPKIRKTKKLEEDDDALWSNMFTRNK